MALLPTGSDLLLEFWSASLHFSLHGRSCASIPGASFLDLYCEEPFQFSYHGTPQPTPEASEGGYCRQDDACPLLLCGETYTFTVESLSGALPTLSADGALCAESAASGTALHGCLSPGWEAGRVRFSVLADGITFLTVHCMLLPRDKALREAIGPMREALRQAAYGLAFSSDGHSCESFVPGNGVHEELWSFWCRFRVMENDFLAALDRIKACPHRGISRSYRFLPPEKVKKTDRKTSRWLSDHPNSPMLPAPVGTVSFDTPENRDLLFHIDRLLLRLEALGRTVPDAKKAHRQLAEKRRELFSGEVISPAPLHSPSPVLSGQPGYRRFYLLLRNLNAPLAFGKHGFLLPVRPLKELYYDWCFVFLHRFLSVDCGMLPKSGLPLSRNAAVLSLSPTRSTDYLDPRTGALLSLRPLENRAFLLTRQSGRSALQITFFPDLFFRPGLFSSTSAFEGSISPSPGLPYDTVSYGLVLYPDTPPAHRPLKPIKDRKIMALPLLPDWEALLVKTLKALLLSEEQSSFLPSPLSHDTEEALKTADWRHRRVLVGALSSYEQLQTALKHHFYHIPAGRLSPNDLSCHTVAIYQSSHLFGPMAGVCYVGRVTQVCRVRRHEIYQIPKSSDEPYILFKVASWERLPRPIAPDREGLVHLMTTDFLLYHGRTVADLRLEKERDFRLQAYLEKAVDPNCGFVLGNSRIVFTPDEILLFHDKALVNRYHRATLASAPGALFRRLQEDLDELEAEDSPSLQEYSVT